MSHSELKHPLSEEIIKTARSWIDTPYVHQARVKGVGVDCGQLIAGVAEELNIVEKPLNIPSYSTEWHYHNTEEKLCEIIEAFGCVRIDLEDRKPGDIISFKVGKVQSHLGILVTDTRYVHAMQFGEAGKVVEVELQGRMLARLGRAYRFPNTQKEDNV